MKMILLKVVSIVLVVSSSAQAQQACREEQRARNELNQCLDELAQVRGEENGLQTAISGLQPRLAQIRQSRADLQACGTDVTRLELESQRLRAAAARIPEMQNEIRFLRNRGIQLTQAIQQIQPRILQWVCTFVDNKNGFALYGVGASQEEAFQRAKDPIRRDCDRESGRCSNWCDPVYDLPVPPGANPEV